MTHCWALLDNTGHCKTLLDTTGHYWILLDTDSISYPFLLGHCILYSSPAGWFWELRCSSNEQEQKRRKRKRWNHLFDGRWSKADSEETLSPPLLTHMHNTVYTCCYLSNCNFLGEILEHHLLGGGKYFSVAKWRKVPEEEDESGVE